jgi:hypothetical protein
MLQAIAKRIFDFCIQHKIPLESSWVSRDMNVEADADSKILDFDDWAVSPLVLQYFNNLWGPFLIDRFADNRNKHVEIFNCHSWRPGTSAVDAFAFDWSGNNNWLVPPVHLVNKVIQYMIKCWAEGTLVVPK